MKLTFTYTNPKEDPAEYDTGELYWENHQKVMNLSNSTNLYGALEIMVEWCLKRGFRITGWTVTGKYGR